MGPRQGPPRTSLKREYRWDDTHVLHRLFTIKFASMLHRCRVCVSVCVVFSRADVDTLRILHSPSSGRVGALSRADPPSNLWPIVLPLIVTHWPGPESPLLGSDSQQRWWVSRWPCRLLAHTSTAWCAWCRTDLSRRAQRCRDAAFHGSRARVSRYAHTSTRTCSRFVTRRTAHATSAFVYT